MYLKEDQFHVYNVRTRLTLYNEFKRRLTRNRQLLETLVSQQKKYLLSYQWLHEDLLSVATSGLTAHCQPTRKDVLTELHRVSHGHISSAIVPTQQFYSHSNSIYLPTNFTCYLIKRSIAMHRNRIMICY